jgi:hypothetical protein
MELWCGNRGREEEIYSLDHLRGQIEPDDAMLQQYELK